MEENDRKELASLRKKKESLKHEVSIGVDTEDTWYDLDAVNYNIALIRQQLGEVGDISRPAIPSL